MERFQDISMLLGRVFLSLMFIVSGFNKITDYAGTQGYMESMGVPALMLPLVIILELLGGIAILIGFKTRIVALLFIGFNVISALLFHSDFDDQTQMTMFMKNIAIAGGFLLLFAQGAGAYSVDNHKYY
ncbi:DoxX family protein [uncultured Psychrobacter sp.]|jgi:putative oxidoreductase|uniref:DoxX family protein n=1 Tax=uncultured Psychrobacter sp. TaxID=259303 RepID=UPI0026398596|nr:DoxX family protein [uncultured Psychrobacter sp.]|tara:strand:- start:23 stop:409 length:387 start_codon:yes stop_codon:yes gene_type:complete